MDKLGMPVTEYRMLLVSATGEIARGLGDAGVITQLLRSWLVQGRKWITRSGPGVLVKILVFVAILAAFRLLSRLVQKAVARSIDSARTKPSMLLRNLITGMVGNLVMVAGLLVALSQLGVSLAPLLAGIGVAGFIVGFALQDTLANFASGIMILFYRPFDVGDVVEAGGVNGRVSHMSLVSTTILTFDNQSLIVPNGKVWGDVIRNVTAQSRRRVDMVFGISYSDDIPHAESVLKAIVEEHDKILENPEPIIKVAELADSSVNFIVRPWVKTADYWDVLWDVTREVKIRFDSENISIPFPQRDVHVYEELPTPSEPTTTSSD
jgi:small conductance mechanosensitive channel